MTTRKEPSTTIAIIGGGVGGTLTAFHLVRQGTPIALQVQEGRLMATIASLPDQETATPPLIIGLKSWLLTQEPFLALMRSNFVRDV